MQKTSRPVIGFVSTWPIYQGTTIDRYAHSLIQGISTAANEQGCDILLGCGFSATGNIPQNKHFWPVPGPDVDFVPVGPWNTDGLIIVPDQLTQTQSQYVRDLLRTDFPVIFTTPEGPGPIVAVDNTLGIKQAVQHLIQHGHRQIAFIAGNIGRGGDSEERLQAYQVALKEVGLNQDSRLIAFGEHHKDGGAKAIRQILDANVPFTALVASNDLSCLGAIQYLQGAGFRIPEDVAVIGFDDILDARAFSPSLTTIRHPTFSLGYQSVLTLLSHIRKETNRVERVVVPPRLIIRQSCGCQPAINNLPFQVVSSPEPNYQLADLVHLMAETSLIEARNSLLEDLQEQCNLFLGSLINSLNDEDTAIIMQEVQRVVEWTNERDEDPHIWQAGITVLYQKANALLQFAPHIEISALTNLLDKIHLEISNQTQRSTTRSMLEHMDMMSQLGMITAEMLTAMNLPDLSEILARHLPKVGIENILVAIYNEDSEDKTSNASILFTAGLPYQTIGKKFETRKFPTLDIYPRDKPIRLTILPFAVNDDTFGFVAFSAPNPELCAAIVHNLSAALRTSQLYNDAIQGRHLAEEANRLKSRFLSMVSHELRTPLSLIVGLSEMVLREERNNPDIVNLRDIEQIHISAQHLARLIGDVLDLASSEAGQLHILREPLDLAEVLHVAAKIGEELAREKGLNWKVTLPRHGPIVMGDRTRLRQVTLNLLSNAVKFTSEGKVQLDVVIEKDKVVISVSDSGVGIPVAEQTRIFNEFYSSPDAMNAGKSGMGLGLAITKQLIERHDGHIEVQSPGKLGKGSTFSFYLPIFQDNHLLINQPTSALQNHNLVFILTEEEKTSRELSDYLIKHGFEIQLCYMDKDSEWLTKVIQGLPSAIIIEEQLASREGWAIAGMLKRQPSTESIPILAYSLRNNQGQILELNYLHKPLQPEQLTKELERIGKSNNLQTILVVDDDPSILDFHSRLVEGSGRKVITAKNGREALEQIEKQIPDLILLDLQMPEMDGFAVLDELRARESTRDIPVIILTARLLSDADLERCNRGVATILSKGLFNAEETLRHIEIALSRQHTLNRATQQLIRKAMAYIHTHYAQALSREEIAEYVGISADYLTDCFRQEVGITPSIYIRRYRIRQACELLRDTNQSITQIAMAVGFSEGAHFTRTFQREMGTTPRAYRDNKQR